MTQTVLIVNDIPGVGKVAGNINLPILTAAQLETAILPTVLLSTQTGGDYDNIVFHRLEEDFAAMLAHWQEIGLSFDACLTGYFAGPQQVASFCDYYRQEKVQNPQLKLVTDPIMADLGSFYDGFDQEIAQTFSQLFQYADLVLPNLTEACILTNTPYCGEEPDPAIYEDLADKLLALGPAHVAITGYRKGEDQIGFYLKGQGDRQGQAITHRYYDQEFFGTGDVATSLITAFYSQGLAIPEALAEAGPFIEQVIEDTLALKRPRRLGLRFEPMLLNLACYCQDKFKKW